MPTEDKVKVSRSRKRKKNGNKGPLLVVLVAGIGLLASVLLFKYTQSNISVTFDKYFDGIYYMDGNIARVEPYASKLAVVEKDEIGIEDFAPEAGLAVSLNGGNAIFSKNAYARMNPASTTKLMTILVALKKGNLEDKVTLTNAALITEPGATLANIKPGDTLSLEQLLYGLMLPSGNDAANAIAVHIGGSIEGFAEMMNEEAKNIYATSSNFKNAHGLTEEGHYTSAYDLYLIINECLKYETFRKITTTAAYEPTYTLANGQVFINHWDNSNKYLLGQASLPAGFELIGAKTGTTRAAGACLVMGTKNSAKDEEYVTVVLKAETKDILYQNMDKLLVELSEQS